jgi:hypothetical protein
MQKEQKTGAELEEIILQATGIEVIVIPSPELGWTIIVGVEVEIDKVQGRLEEALPALRARYDLKPK